jgi:hypothetical protein
LVTDGSHMTDTRLNGAAQNGHDPDARPHFTTAEDLNPALPGEAGYEDHVRRRTDWADATAREVSEMPEVPLEPTLYFDAGLGRAVTADDPAPWPAIAPESAPDRDFGMPDVAPAIAAATAGDLRRRTDASNGEFFASIYGDEVRYDHRRKRWLVWNGHWWRDDDNEHVRRLANEAAR